MSAQSSSQFRRSGQRNQRRRRLFAEEAGGAIGRTGASRASHRAQASAECPSENYPDVEIMDEQLRLIDLIPRRLSWFGLLLLAGLAVVVGLQVLYAWMPELAAAATDGRIAALDLDGEGSLAAWFSSTVLILAALVAVMVYMIRRHKIDDYQGYYRVWLWAAMCWLLMSVDEASSLHEGFKEMMAAATGTRLYGDGSLWWVIPYFFLLGAVGTRLLVDMRHCRLSSAALLTAAGCYATAVAVQVLAKGGARAVMLEEGAEMVGNLMLLLAMGLHARYVILDAEGLLPRAEPADHEHTEDELEDEEYENQYEDEKWITVDAAHPKPRPPSRRKRKARKPVAEPEPEPEPAPVQRKLTKAERKALRKRLTQERLKRERQQRSNWT